MTSHSNEKSIKFVCLASSSSGNAFLMRFPAIADNANERVLLVECGLPIRDLEKRLFDENTLIKDINACLITHAHSDHSEAMIDLLSRGVNIYANASTIGQHGGNPKAHIISHDTFSKPIEGITVYSFNTAHNVPILGYLIYDSVTRKTIMFITDTRTFEPSFAKSLIIDYLFIECNHIRQQLEMAIKSITTSDDPKKKAMLIKYERQRDVHLSLLGTKKMIRDYIGIKPDTSVFLIHLSTELANEYVMKKEIEATFGVKTYVCGRKGGIK